MARLAECCNKKIDSGYATHQYHKPPNIVLWNFYRHRGGEIPAD